MISQGRHFIPAGAVQSAFLIIVSLFSLCFFEEQLPAQDKGIADGKQSEVKQLLQRKLDEKEVFIWYLSHSGYAVKTKSALLIFDYWENGQDGNPEDSPPSFSLANGRIKMESASKDFLNHEEVKRHFLGI
jgi:hypothetical protein